MYTHNIEAYDIIIGSLGRIRNFELIWVVVNDMKGKGILTQETFSLVIKWYARARMDKEAIQTFKNMGKFGLSPDLASFNNLLIALCKLDNHLSKFVLPDRKVIIPNAK